MLQTASVATCFALFNSNSYAIHFQAKEHQAMVALLQQYLEPPKATQVAPHAPIPKPALGPCVEARWWADRWLFLHKAHSCTKGTSDCPAVPSDGHASFQMPAVVHRPCWMVHTTSGVGRQFCFGSEDNKSVSPGGLGTQFFFCWGEGDSNSVNCLSLSST